ncbi:tRNA uridine-5-carboxymethylaminomethyl(34) synthesis GTPase MnmE [Luteimonas changyuni]|uniref:tRNA uridine-5-carboxymethylaminomethyl(34) synthesis GTPase MnmE n=1 Tax=Luteimonas sp. MJ145 TaxID=3129234 RepID=UPI0031BBA818
MSQAVTDTIVAVATAAGSGGVGIVRLSGPAAAEIARAVCGGRAPRPRHAQYARFVDAAGETIDDGIVLLFAGPASYTGEDVAELQGHGNPVLLQAVVARCCALGARMARPGEFTERAFLNGRLDLAQAEAVADLVAAGDLTAARAARRSLDGEFSRRVEALAEALVAIRVHAEAAIDFADEPLDTLGGAELAARLDRARTGLAALLATAERGRRLRDGLDAVIVGPPNAGKSSLLNALAGSERAIVTDIAGTTRDLLRETVHVDGAELTLVDTAGLREGGDAIEREGMRRARDELAQAGLAIAVVDARDPDAGRDAIATGLAGVPRILWLHNKADLLPAGAPPPPTGELRVSAATGQGMDELHLRLRRLVMGEPMVGGEPVIADTAAGEGEFTARARHVEALGRAAAHLDRAALELAGEALDLAAESLRTAHRALGDITGQVGADELLGHIFSRFCVGK